MASEPEVVLAAISQMADEAQSAANLFLTLLVEANERILTPLACVTTDDPQIAHIITAADELRERMIFALEAASAIAHATGATG